ncbi:MAG: FAD-binding oxidoreductase, partial [Pseudomonadota bacterium]|nr:FAD-binding oxidoreductase [Pseudomonadota bacterium]
MIAMVSEVAVRSGYVAFLDALRACGFEGEIAPDDANRTVLATDNSIYQRLPQAAVFPKHAED